METYSLLKFYISGGNGMEENRNEIVEVPMTTEVKKEESFIRNDAKSGVLITLAGVGIFAGANAIRKFIKKRKSKKASEEEIVEVEVVEEEVEDDEETTEEGK